MVLNTNIQNRAALSSIWSSSYAHWKYLIIRFLRHKWLLIRLFLHRNFPVIACVGEGLVRGLGRGTGEDGCAE